MPSGSVIAELTVLRALNLSNRAPKVVTTLHGTDITLVGNDPSYSEIVAFSIEQSDGVTAVSESLRASTVAELKEVTKVQPEDKLSAAILKALTAEK